MTPENKKEFRTVAIIFLITIGIGLLSAFVSRWFLIAFIVLALFLWNWRWALVITLPLIWVCIDFSFSL